LGRLKRFSTLNVANFNIGIIYTPSYNAKTTNFCLSLQKI
jgi:hypothetical protein